MRAFQVHRTLRPGGHPASGGQRESNSRVPEYFGAFAGRILGSWPGLFGFVIPLLETALGVALIIGALSLPAALASLLTLMTYWSFDDQPIAQYPIMGILSAVVIAWSAWAARLSADIARRGGSEP